MHNERLRILLLEDESLIRKIEVVVLKHELESDLDIVEASDGDEALKLYSEHGPYDLVLTDLLHPGMDGVALVRAIRKENPNQPIGFITAWRQENVENVARNTKTGTHYRKMSAFMRRTPIAILQKPYGPEELVELVVSLTHPENRSGVSKFMPKPMRQRLEHSVAYEVVQEFTAYTREAPGTYASEGHTVRQGTIVFADLKYWKDNSREEKGIVEFSEHASFCFTDWNVFAASTRRIVSGVRPAWQRQVVR